MAAPSPNEDVLLCRQIKIFFFPWLALYLSYVLYHMEWKLLYEESTKVYYPPHEKVGACDAFNRNDFQSPCVHCYTCTSDADPGCGRKFDNNSITDINPCPSSWCYRVEFKQKGWVGQKMVEILKGNLWTKALNARYGHRVKPGTVYRGCLNKTRSGVHHNEPVCNTGLYKGLKAQICLCNDNKCNKAGRFLPSFSLLLYFSAILMGLF